MKLDFLRRCLHEQVEGRWHYTRMNLETISWCRHLSEYKRLRISAFGIVLPG